MPSTDRRPRQRRNREAAFEQIPFITRALAIVALGLLPGLAMAAPLSASPTSISLVSGGDIGSFHLLEENCTSNVFTGNPRLFQPGESCTAKVVSEPTAAGAEATGAKTATLRLRCRGATTVAGLTAKAPPRSRAPWSRD